MYPNTKSYFARALSLAAMFSLFFLSKGNVIASRGADLAKEMLQKIQTASTKQEEDDFLQKATQGKSLLSSQDRVDYAEYLYNVVASSAKTNNEQRAWLAMSLLRGGINEQEILAGRARLLASSDPAVRGGAGNFSPLPMVKLPNGELGQDISLFSLALQDSGVPRDKLIEVMFKLAPVESAQWFADHAGLPATQRAGLESDLQEAWKLHRAPYGPAADTDTKAKLDHWLYSPSWILRDLGNGLLQKRQEWQTPDLKKAMQPVQVPAGLQITPGQ